MVRTSFFKNKTFSPGDNRENAIEPEDIAQGILFLAVNPAITGQTVVLDNGRLPT